MKRTLLTPQFAAILSSIGCDTLLNIVDGSHFRYQDQACKNFGPPMTNFIAGVPR
jgi:hypothetical protein